jgi:predicted lipoprotein with Yx(FWY)xxD motif
MTVAGVLILAACGSDDDSATTESQPTTDVPADEPEPDSGSEPEAGPAAAPDVAIGTTELGDVLVGAGELTLYGFTNDVDGVSSCVDACADAWPPLIVGDDWSTAPGLDPAVFTTTTRGDGSQQLVAGSWPLYFFAADVAPGDTHGQGSGDVWFVVDPSGRLIDDDAAQPIASIDSSGEGY